MNKRLSFTVPTRPARISSTTKTKNTIGDVFLLISFFLVIVLPPSSRPDEHPVPLLLCYVLRGDQTKHLSIATSLPLTCFRSFLCLLYCLPYAVILSLPRPRFLSLFMVYRSVRCCDNVILIYWSICIKQGNGEENTLVFLSETWNRSINCQSRKYHKKVLPLLFGPPTQQSIYYPEPSFSEGSPRHPILSFCHYQKMICSVAVRCSWKLDQNPRRSRSRQPRMPSGNGFGISSFWSERLQEEVG